jgi:uncharacterized membrane protein YdjX (TVP38/TMEM64 family)
MKYVRLVSAVMMLISVLVLVRLLPVDALIKLLIARVDGLGVWGPAVFAVVYVLGAVLFVPGSALTLAAGAVFGLAKGTAVVSIAATTAAAVSFLVARYLARDAVGAWASRNPKFGAIDQAIGKGGWRIIALLRLSPAVPFSLGNYLFGLTSIRFWPYAVTSWVAMLPGTFMFVYLGYAGRAGLSAASGTEAGKSPAQWALLVVGLVATVVVTVYVTRIARRAVAESTDAPDAVMQPASTPMTPKPARLAPTLALAAGAVLMTGCATAGYFNRAKLKNLFGPPQATLTETFADASGDASFDHSLIDQVLQQHVDDLGRVNYAALKADPTRLDAYIASLAQVNLNTLGRDERLALLINAYNAFTVRLIVDHYPVASIKDIPSADRWDSKRWNVGGNTWSLNDIEHEQIRPNFVEPRIHFALVCAARGCPPLKPHAYEAATLDAQLEAATRYVHAHPTWLQYTAGSGTIRLTALYNWYGGDFEQVSGDVLSYVARYSAELKAALDSGQKPRAEFLDYDWSLNVQPEAGEVSQ